MDISKIEQNLQDVMSNFSPETFIYDLLGAYGKPKASITRLQKGDYNLSKKENEILWKKNLFFKRVNGTDLRGTYDQIFQTEKIIKHDPRFIIVSDCKTILAFDTKTTDKLDIPINELVDNFKFFLPLTGRENVVYYKENAADIKAAERMAKIYDEICKNNPGFSCNNASALNVFLSRLLFCFFAESTQLFKQNLFSETIDTRTKEDGSDLDQYFDALFKLLNTEESKRGGYSKYLNAFPYVNGGLFKTIYRIPRFSNKLRRMIIECARLDWSVINPDIFGSMIQAVADSDQRSDLGIHYTSVTNIMKVIKPLFLDDLYQEFEKCKNNKQKLTELYKRLDNIKIFDPACGSGNFLIIAYKELRKLEIQLLKCLEGLGKHPTFLSQIQLSQFYGIEIDGFACEIAKLSLLLAEQQMNIQFKNTFGKVGPSLPLKQGGQIVCGNATRLNWEEVCTKDKKAEIYLLGNPPYLGTRNQSAHHKKDMSHVFQSFRNFKSLDYISCWFRKGVDYIKGSNSCLAFVSTNSITQGDQVSLLWPHIISKELEIFFCHQSFKWVNNAKSKAGVTCVIVGICNKDRFKNKKIITDNIEKHAENINYYLVPGKNVVVNRLSTPIDDRPRMIKGSIPADGGHLILNRNEYIEFSKHYELKPLIKKFIGAQEFIDGIERWCLYITDESYKKVKDNPLISKRINGVIKMRMESSKNATNKLAQNPYKFAEDRYYRKPCIIIPCTTSENRDYIPMGFQESGPVIYASAQAIYDAEPYVFGIISSHMHMVWIKTVAGRLKTDFRYSSTLCYNTFPFPILSNKSKQDLKMHVLNLLDERQKHPEKTLGELYDPKKMPEGLRKAHRSLDAAVDRCYRLKPFESDEERLEYLLKLYERMVQTKGDE